MEGIGKGRATRFIAAVPAAFPAGGGGLASLFRSRKAVTHDTGPGDGSRANLDAGITGGLSLFGGPTSRNRPGA